MITVAGVIRDVEGDEGVLVPQPGGEAHGAAHQEDPRQYRHTRLHQTINLIHTHSLRL